MHSGALVFRCLINCKVADQWDSAVGPHNAKRKGFSPRLLPEEDIFKLEEVGEEILWDSQRKVTRLSLPASWPRRTCVGCKSMGQADTSKNYGGS